jgi:hypothetical protein
MQAGKEAFRENRQVGRVGFQTNRQACKKAFSKQGSLPSIRHADREAFRQSDIDSQTNTGSQGGHQTNVKTGKEAFR